VTRIFVAGPATWNQLVYVDALPQPRAHSLAARSHHETVGGTSAGKALNLRALGLDVTLVTPLGDDDAGRRVESVLRDAGVDLLVERAERTERHLNLMAGGDRVSIFLDTPGQVGREHDEAVDRALAEAAYACIDLADSARPYLARAKSAGVPVVCDLHDYDGANPWYADWIDAADVLFVNADGMTDPVPWMQAQVARGTYLVVLTQGASGATAVTAEETLHVPADHVEHVVDTNGAGDAFAAGFLHARLGRAALPVAMRAGHAHAARCLASPDLAPPSSGRGQGQTSSPSGSTSISS
jgi:sugar/nucleoside kinase (ribokinase family)